MNLRRTSKLLLSMITFILIVLTFGTSTFAWFTLSENGEVSNINITVGGGEGIEISLDGKNFYATITEKELMDYIKSVNNEQNVVLKPVTSPDGRTAYDLNGKELKEVEDGRNVNYIKIKIYFRAYNVKKPSISGLGLGAFLEDFESDATYTNAPIHNGTYIVSKGVTSKADVTYKDYDSLTGDSINVNYDDSIKKYASDSMRVSFYDNQTSFYDTKRDATKCYDLSSRNGKSLSNYGYGFGYDSDKENLIGSASFFFSKTGKMLTPPELDVDVYDIDNGFSTFGVDSRALYAENNNGFICYLTKTSDTTYEGSATMMIWLEGYDSDCYDLIFRDSSIISLKFRLAYRAN